jgi:transketolase
LESVYATNQAEIQQIVRDSAVKIGKLKESIESKQSSMNQMAALDKAQRKFDLEKKTCIEQIEVIRTKAEKREQRLAREYQEKFNTIKTEVENMSAKFRDKMNTFEMTNNELKASLDDARKSGTAGLQDVLAKHEKELADLVRVSNEKYQNMLVELMSAQEKLREEMEKRIIEAGVEEPAVGNKNINKAEVNQKIIVPYIPSTWATLLLPLPSSAVVAMSCATVFKITEVR